MAKPLVEKLPVELQIMVMEHLDPISLCNLLEAMPSTMPPAYLSRFEPITKSILQTCWPEEELSQYLYAIILAKHRGRSDFFALKSFLNFHFHGTHPRRLVEDFPRSLESLRDICHLFDAVEFFVGFCTEFFLVDMPTAMQQRPLSTGEQFRLRRALLRFHLYCQLFHQPGGDVDGFSSDRDWERRHMAQFLFWTQLERVEIEECKCIYLLLYAYLRELGPLNVAEEWANLGVHDDSSWRQMRGLPILRRIIEGGEAPSSAFNVSYAQSFQIYAFSGLDELDPSDCSAITPTSYWNFSSQRWEWLVVVSVMTKRYPPSDASRELNFEAAHQGHWTGAWLRRLGHTKRDWRLAGYCFWDTERVVGFETHRCSGCRHYAGPRPRVAGTGEYSLI